MQSPSRNPRQQALIDLADAAARLNATPAKWLKLPAQSIMRKSKAGQSFVASFETHCHVAEGTLKQLLTQKTSDLLAHIFTETGYHPQKATCGTGHSGQWLHSHAVGVMECLTRVHEKQAQEPVTAYTIMAFKAVFAVAMNAFFNRHELTDGQINIVRFYNSVPEAYLEKGYPGDLILDFANAGRATPRTKAAVKLGWCSTWALDEDMDAKLYGGLSLGNVCDWADRSSVDELITAVNDHWAALPKVALSVVMQRMGIR